MTGTAIPWARPKMAGKRGLSTIDRPLRELIRTRAGGCCECCGERLPWPFEAHHRKLRSRGGQDSACNLAALCGLCHRRIHGHPKWAAENGFMVASGDDPALAAMLVRCESWRLLTVDGLYLDAETGVGS